MSKEQQKSFLKNPYVKYMIDALWIFSFYVAWQHPDVGWASKVIEFHFIAITLVCLLYGAIVLSGYLIKMPDETFEEWYLEDKKNRLSNLVLTVVKHVLLILGGFYFNSLSYSVLVLLNLYQQDFVEKEYKKRFGTPNGENQ
ncbi:MAG: hypothetical protein AAGM67_04850 [Bacteroidota bacterium]